MSPSCAKIYGAYQTLTAPSIPSPLSQVNCRDFSSPIPIHRTFSGNLTAAWIQTAWVAYAFPLVFVADMEGDQAVFARLV